MAPSKSEVQVITWLDNKDYTALFTRMCCCHFAIASFNADFGDLFYFESNVDSRYLGHVFVIHPLTGPFDVLGHRCVDEMLTTLTWCAGPAVPCDKQRIAREIDTLGLSPRPRSESS